jgi:hypothetical protein
MTHIRTRNPAGGEFSFYSREEFVRAVERGGITPEWQVLHGASGRWLPITAHPAFTQSRKPRASGRTSGPERARPSSELVLIYPDPTKVPRTSMPPAPPPDEVGPVLTPVEIERVLRPRTSLPNTLPPAPPAAERAWSTAVRPSGGKQVESEESFHVSPAGPSALPRVLLVGLVLLLFLAVLSAARGKKPHTPVDPRPAATTQAAPNPAPPAGQLPPPPATPSALQGR